MKSKRNNPDPEMPEKRPKNEELLDENKRLKQQVVELKEEIARLTRIHDEFQDKVDTLKAALKKIGEICLELFRRIK